MASHELTVTGTRQIFGDSKGYITLLGVADTSEFNKEEKMEVKYIAKELTLDEFPGEIKENLGVIAPIKISLKEANDFLKTGFFQGNECSDERLRTGESVIVYVGDERIKVTSSSFAWRNSLRGGNPSIECQYYHLVCSPFDPNDYITLAPGPVSMIKTLLEKGENFFWAPIVELNDTELDIYQTDVYARARFIYFNYLLSLPPSDQKSFADLYNNFVSGTDRLVGYIMSFYRGRLHFVDPRNLREVKAEEQKNPVKGCLYIKGGDTRHFEITNLNVPVGKDLVILKGPHPRVINITTQSSKFTNEYIQKRNIRASDAFYEKQMIYNIRYLLSKENANTRYQMTRQCNAWKI